MVMEVVKSNNTKCSIQKIIMSKLNKHGKIVISEYKANSLSLPFYELLLSNTYSITLLPIFLPHVMKNGHFSDEFSLSTLTTFQNVFEPTEYPLKSKQADEEKTNHRKIYRVDYCRQCRVLRLFDPNPLRSTCRTEYEW